MVDQARHIVDTVVDSTDGHFLKANYEAYGKYGFDQLLGTGNPYDNSLQYLIDKFDSRWIINHARKFGEDIFMDKFSKEVERIMKL